jgi:ribosome-associated toxin RatA of RatAB toxin-antitoxin module
MGVKVLEGRAERSLAASAERCFALLRDVERWPEWLSTVRSVSVVERDDSGRPTRVLVEASMLGLPLWFGAEVSVREPNELRLERVAFEEHDPETLELALSLEATEGGGCRATAELSAAVELPRLLPLPRAVGDQVAGRLLSDLAERTLDS